jgi:hypothetical protein
MTDVLCEIARRLNEVPAACERVDRYRDLVEETNRRIAEAAVPWVALSLHGARCAAASQVHTTERDHP